LESADTHLLLVMIMTMLRFYQACRKSTDTEGVELSSYPDSSGSMVAPPKVKDVLTGGKRKDIKTNSS